MRVGLLDSVLSLDLPTEVEQDLRELLDEDTTSLAPTASVTVARSGLSFSIHADQDVRIDLDRSGVLEALLEVVNRTVLHQCRDLAVHAGAVARNGQVLAFPADSGGGKTTLTAALLRLGWCYVSDEALVLDSQARVRPYPKWLSLHDWSLTRLGLRAAGAPRTERPVALRELGGTAATGDLRLTHIVLMQRGVGKARLTDGHRAAAAAEVLRCSFNHYRDPAAALTLTAQAMATAAVSHLVIDDPVQAAELLSATL